MITIKVLLDLCDSFDEFTMFYCYDIKEDYCCAGVEFARLKMYQLANLYSDCFIKKFYIYHSSNRVDLLFFKETTNG